MSSLSVVGLGIASFVAAGTFASSLQTMIDRPSVSGKTWNGVINIGFDPTHVPDQIARAITEDPGIEALAFADSGAPLRIFAGPGGRGPARGISVLGFFVRNMKGSLFPPVVEGRAPRDKDEVVLGARMIRALGLRFDPAHPPTIRMQLEGGEAFATLRVVHGDRLCASHRVLRWVYVRRLLSRLGDKTPCAYAGVARSVFR